MCGLDQAPESTERAGPLARIKQILTGVFFCRGRESSLTERANHEVTVYYSLTPMMPKDVDLCLLKNMLGDECVVVQGDMQETSQMRQNGKR